MNTARDLVIVAMGGEQDRPVETGDLSLALAGAELLDLAEAGALTLDDDLIVPGAETVPADRLLAEAARALLRQEPYETVEDWLWRRGRGLSSAYVVEFERDGLIARKRDHRISLGGRRAALVDSPERSRAERRLADGERVLVALTVEVGIRDEPPAGDGTRGTEGAEATDEAEGTGEVGGSGESVELGTGTEPENGTGTRTGTAAEEGTGTENGNGTGAEEPDDPVDRVLAAVGSAVTELEGVRRRRAVEDAAYENVWRGL
ncbi:GPP34 family phosphoprotein [Streptomyces griseoviridis]|uniref:GPP34 family phosphoprotein n=1 Tax=Streptomyces hintoniae TaxID=3075521 RepID=A0ABU2UJK6_9ACTN|nr:GPP34 family phosphoprotein [Streptomyces sp. DSM 41014]MDT0473355.1 GPP34 family phosphoprotein [Streptomyces sp. DSM 41014]